jgi:hypothetical protein
MADGDTVITIKLKLDEGDAESSAATAGKDAGEAFRKAFEEATKGLDVSKGLKSDDLKKTFSQIGDEGKKTAKDLQDAFAKVQMPAAPRGPAVPAAAPAVPHMQRPPVDDRLERYAEATNTALESFAKLAQGVSPILLAQPYIALLARRLMGGAAEGREAAEAATYERRLTRGGLAGGRGVGVISGLVQDIGAEGILGGAPSIGSAFGRVAGGATQAAFLGQAGTDIATRFRAVQQERLRVAQEAKFEEERGVKATKAVNAVEEAKALTGGVGGKLVKIGEGAAAGAMAGEMVAPGPGGAVGMAVGGGLAFISAITLGTLEARKAIRELGESAVETGEDTEHLAKTLAPAGMGTTEAVKQFQAMKLAVSSTGLDIDSFGRSIVRLATDMTRRMPEIRREYESSGDELEAANIKVRESSRDVTKAQLAQEEATDNVSKAQGELAIQEATGAERREEQFTRAQLGVSGAAIGLRGAQMQERQAQIGLQFAPTQEALQAAQEPLTTKGAETGLGGAKIQQWRAGIALRQAEGETVDPEEIKRLRLASVRQQYTASVQAREEAEQRVKQTKLETEERQAERAAGLGPTGQARQRELQATQARQRAELTEREAKTQETTIRLQQEFNTLQMAHNAALRTVTAAQLNQQDAGDKVTESNIGLNEANRNLAREREKNVKELVGAIERPGEPGAPALETAPPERLLDAMIIAADRAKRPGGRGVLEQLVGTIQGAPEDTARNLALVQATLPRLIFRGQEGIAAAQQFIEFAKGAPKGGIGAFDEKNLSKEDQGLLGQFMEAFEGGEAGRKKLLAKMTRSQRRLEIQRFVTGTEPGVLEKAGGVVDDDTLAAVGTYMLLRRVLARGEPGVPSNPLTAPLGGLAPPGRFRPLVPGQDFLTPPGGLVPPGRFRPFVPDPSVLQQPGAGVRPQGTSEAGTDHLQVHEVGTVKAELSGGSVEVHGTVAISNLPGAPASGLPGAPQQGAPALPGGDAGSAPALQGAASALQGAASALQGAANALQQGGGGGGLTATELARGGLIRGPGSGTSDSIPILASNGEYIIRQSRVAQLGVPFLDALNNRQMRFGLGGLVMRQGGGSIDQPVLRPEKELLEAWVKLYGVQPDPAAWQAVLDAGLNPFEALDKDGKLTRDAAKRVAELLATQRKPPGPNEKTQIVPKHDGSGTTAIKITGPSRPVRHWDPIAGQYDDAGRATAAPRVSTAAPSKDTAAQPGPTTPPSGKTPEKKPSEAPVRPYEKLEKTQIVPKHDGTGTAVIKITGPSRPVVHWNRQTGQYEDDEPGPIRTWDRQRGEYRGGYGYGTTDQNVQAAPPGPGQTTIRIIAGGQPRTVTVPIYSGGAPGSGGAMASTPGGPTPGALTPGTPGTTTIDIMSGGQKRTVTVPIYPGGAPGSGGPMTSTPGGPTLITPYPTYPGGAAWPGGPMVAKPGRNIIVDPAYPPQPGYGVQVVPGMAFIPHPSNIMPPSITDVPKDVPSGIDQPLSWGTPTGPTGRFFTQGGVPVYRPPENGLSLDFFGTDQGKAAIPQGSWRVWDASRGTFIDMKPGTLDPVDAKAVMTPAPVPVTPGPAIPAAPPDPNQPVLPTPSGPPSIPIVPLPPLTPTVPLPPTAPLPRLAPVPIIPLPLPAPPRPLDMPPVPPASLGPTRPTEDMLKDLRENVIPSMIPMPQPAPGRLGRPEEQEIPKDLPPPDLLEAPSRHGEAERKVREASINGGDDEGAWRGGLIRLSGGGLVPAMVSNGEYRMSPEAVSHYGVSLFDRLNGGGFAGGGTITMGRAQPPRPAGFPSGFSPIPEPGLIGEIANAMRNIGSVDPGVIRTMTGVASGAGEVASTHRLDLVTSAGTFTVQAGAETLAAIQSSAIGGKLTSTGTRPSWY